MVVDGFHLLRPDALWLLLLVIPSALLLQRASQRAGTWQKVIDPDLLKYVLVGQSTTRRRHGHWLIALALALAVFAIAGPSVKKVEVPVFQRADALVIVLDLSASMTAADTQPSRVRRARQKILDVLAERNEGVTGMVVYAGDAHVVAPLTDDRRTIENLLPALDPSIMPLPGSDATAAITAAAELLVAAGVANGQLLLITDDIPKFDASDVRRALDNANASISILGIGTRAGAPIPRADGGFIRDQKGDIVVPGLPINRLEDIAEELNGRYETVTLDSADLDSLLLAPALTDSGEIQLDRKTDTWLDQGNWLALLLALGCLPLFRRGAITLLLLAPLLYSQPSDAQTFRDLWLTPDQQGIRLLEQGDPKAAADLFNDPNWRGTAHYQAEDWLKAVDSFDNPNDANSLYNKGNALAKAGEYQRAITAYDESLALKPDAEDTLFNRDLVEQLLQQQDNQQSEQGEEGDQNEQDQSQDGSEGNDSKNQSENDGDDTESQNQDGSSGQSEGGSEGDGESEGSSSDQSGGQPMEEDGEQTNDAMREAMERELDAQTQAKMSKFDEALEEQQALEQWLRRVPDDPGGLLRRKFRYESIQRLRKGEEPDEDIRW